MAFGDQRHAKANPVAPKGKRPLSERLGELQLIRAIHEVGVGTDGLITENQAEMDQTDRNQEDGQR